MNKKVVLITGASNGIGSAIAKVFATNGYSIAINYNKSKENAFKLCEELSKLGVSCVCYQADVSDANQVEHMVSEIISDFGHIDVLINNAGICSNNLLIDETTENINAIVSTNLLGTIYTAKETAKQMLKNGGGVILNMASVWGLVGASMESVYSASKGGIIAFTKALAKELAYNNIRVNAIAPGVVCTNMMNVFTEEEKAEIKDEIPMQRFAKPNEIAKLCLFMAENDSSYITGQTIQIDGGFAL